MPGIHDLTVTTFRQMLEAMRGQLAKAASHAADAGSDPDSLLDVRLADDMFPLSAQIRFSCGLAKECFARLSGAPVEPAPEIESIDEGIALIGATLLHLDSLRAGPIDDSAESPVELALPIGLTFDLKGGEYVRDWALPQFYFHVLMTYAILRSQGVPLGKGDYVPHMGRYLRG